MKFSLLALTNRGMNTNDGLTMTVLHLKCCQFLTATFQLDWPKHLGGIWVEPYRESVVCENQDMGGTLFSLKGRKGKTRKGKTKRGKTKVSN